MASPKVGSPTTSCQCSTGSWRASRVPPLPRERGEAPVVEDEEPGSGEPLDELGVAAVAAGEGEFVEEPREAVLEGEFGDVGHGGLLLERLCHAGEPEFVEQIESGLAKHDGQDSFRLGDVPLRAAA